MIALAAKRYTLSVDCIEIQPKNCEVLRDLGFNTIEADFLDLKPVQMYSHVHLIGLHYSIPISVDVVAYRYRQKRAA